MRKSRGRASEAARDLVPRDRPLRGGTTIGAFMVRRFFSVRRAALALVAVLAVGTGLALTPAPASAAIDFGAGVRAIDAKYASSNFAAILGAPTSDTFQTPQRQGLYRHYERGSIYWAPWIGAR